MHIKRVCELTELTARCENPATRNEVRELAREVIRLRTALRNAKINSEYLVARCDEDLVEDRLGERWK